MAPVGASRNRYIMHMLAALMAGSVWRNILITNGVGGFGFQPDSATMSRREIQILRIVRGASRFPNTTSTAAVLRGPSVSR